MNIRLIIHFPLLLIIILFISSCSPHPSAGNWKASDENTLGITDLKILFEGKAEFTMTLQDKAEWHCFWAAQDKNNISMNCVPSTDTERRELFDFNVSPDGQGKLSQNGKIISNFQRQAYQ